MGLTNWAIELCERGLIPDRLVRLAMRRLCAARMRECERRAALTGADGAAADDDPFVRELRAGPLALLPEKANQQHYELPAEFFGLVLGPHRKYSCCLWPDDADDLAADVAADEFLSDGVPGLKIYSAGGGSLGDAEAAALQATCERAELTDGQDVLELGCGWGSLSLWMAERHPRSRIVAVSNSGPQRRYIEAEAARRGLRNLRVLTADMNLFDAQQATGRQFDRIVSVEMFEHLRNYELLLERIAGWLRPDGKLFVHIFCHRRHAYPFESEGESNWMGRHFFSGGMMPSDALLTRFSRHLAVVRRWRWNGRQYRRTAEAWLENLDARRDEATAVLETVYGRAEAPRWRRRWRMFFMAVAELFGCQEGNQWHVSHYLLEPTRAAAACRSAPSMAGRSE